MTRTPHLKIAGFVTALAVLLGLGALLGSAAGSPPGRDAKPMAAGAHPMAAMAAQPVRGLAVSENGLTLRLARTTATPGRRTLLTFRIVDRRGVPVRAFDVEHTKRMHFIVVRRDLTGFQHLHPTMAPDGTWSVPVTVHAAGTYRVFADFSAAGRAHTLAADLTADGAVRSHPLPAPAATAPADGLRVRLAEGASRAGAESNLAFAVTRGGAPAATQPYLGAQGHLVALREGDLAFLHVHPDHDSLRFMAQFPSAGRYRLFLQVKVDGRVHTAAFTQEVSR